MPIVDISHQESMDREELSDSKEEKSCSTWESFFSSSCARLFFLLLIVFDALWFVYNVCKMGVCLVLHLCFFGRSSLLEDKIRRGWISIKRALICELALLVALFSPAFGIMIGCTYFLMYDRKGIEEVVPASLRSQFKELFDSNVGL